MEVLAAFSRDIFPWVILQVKIVPLEWSACMGHQIILTISLLFVQQAPLVHYFGGIMDYATSNIAKAVLLCKINTLNSLDEYCGPLSLIIIIFCYTIAEENRL